MYTKFQFFCKAWNENDQDNGNHPDNKNKDNYPANKYMFKVNNRKKVLMSLWLALNIFHNLFY